MKLNQNSTHFPRNSNKKKFPNFLCGVYNNVNNDQALWDYGGKRYIKATVVLLCAVSWINVFGVFIHKIKIEF